MNANCFMIDLLVELSVLLLSCSLCSCLWHTLLREAVQMFSELNHLLSALNFVVDELDIKC